MVQVCAWSSDCTRQDWMIAIETDRIFSMSSNLKLKKKRQDSSGAILFKFSYGV